MIGAAAHTAAMLGVEGAAGSCWERRGATPWPQERSDTCLNMCQCVGVRAPKRAKSRCTMGAEPREENFSPD